MTGHLDAVQATVYVVMHCIFFWEYIVFGWCNLPPDFYNLLLLAWWLWVSYAIFRTEERSENMKMNAEKIEFPLFCPKCQYTCDTVLTLLTGSFALLAVGFVWVEELVDRKRSKKD